MTAQRQFSLTSIAMFGLLALACFHEGGFARRPASITLLPAPMAAEPTPQPQVKPRLEPMIETVQLTPAEAKALDALESEMEAVHEVEALNMGLVEKPWILGGR